MGNFNFCTFTQIRNGLTGWRFKIPASAYCQPLWAMQRHETTISKFDKELWRQFIF